MNKTESVRKGSKKKLIISLCAALIIILMAVDVFGANFLVSYAIGRGGDGGDRGDAALEVQLPPDGIERIIAENGKKDWELNGVFLEEHPETAVSIEGASGLKLNGGYFENEGSHKWAITIHGYRSRHEHMATFIRNYYENGFQVIAPDLEACGESEGEYIGMGWPDRLDILKWIDWIVEQDPEAQIVVHGISMGGATTLMTSGEPTPDNVVAFVEDCGYTSVYEIFASELNLRFHLPEFPLMQTANTISKIRAKYSFTEASSLEQVKKCEKPMLFIHGTSDDFIPYEMMGILYEAKPGDNKKMISVEGAGHGQATSAMGEEYWTEVFDFIGQYFN